MEDEIEADDVGSCAGGSGRHSRLDFWQVGQTQSRDLWDYTLSERKIKVRVTYSAASRLRSAAGYSRAPTPTAAVPLSGKKPWSPMMADNTSGLLYDASNSPLYLCALPRLVATAPHDLRVIST